MRSLLIGVFIISLSLLCDAQEPSVIPVDVDMKSYLAQLDSNDFEERESASKMVVKRLESNLNFTYWNSIETYSKDFSAESKDRLDSAERVAAAGLSDKTDVIDLEYFVKHRLGTIRRLTAKALLRNKDSDKAFQLTIGLLKDSDMEVRKQAILILS